MGSDWDQPITDKWTSIPIGSVSPSKGYLPAGNPMLTNHDPIVRRIAMFCEMTPDQIPPGIASFGGMLLGLRIGQSHPEVLAKVMDAIVGDKGTEPLDEMVDKLING